MARLYTSGFELGHVQAEGLTASGTPTFDTSTFRTGAASLAVNAASTYAYRSFTGATGRGYYARAYLRVAATPTAEIRLLTFATSSALSTLNANVRVGTDLKLVLRDTNGTVVYTDATARSSGQWYQVELFINVAAAGNSSVELRVDNVSVYSSASFAASNTAPGVLVFGQTTATAPGTTVFFDDVALNDDQGASQTTWPGAGEVRYLRPASDPGSSSANWTKPGGATSNRHTSVDNTPPVFETYDSTSASAEDYVSNAVNGAGAALILDCTSYTTGGVPDADSITLVQALADTGSSSSTDTAGTLGISANPVVAQASFAAFDNGIASATATTWPRQEGTVSYVPTPTRATAPTIRVEKTTGTTRVAIVNALAVLVESAPTRGRSHATLQAVNRAASY